MENRADKHYKDGYNCAQAILLAYADQADEKEKELMLKLSAGLGYGMYSQETCGAVTAAIAVLGIKYGNTLPKDRKNIREVFKKIKIFEQNFKEKNQSFNCQELKGVYAKDCTQLIKDSASLLEKMIEGEIENESGSGK